MRLPVWLYSLIVCFGLFFTTCKKASPAGGTGTPPPTPVENKFLHADGNLIKDGDGNAIKLQGVAFGNDIWSDIEVPTTHHSETDFMRLKEMHMNVVRFYINYKTFESDATPYTYKQTGWDWIDKNITWAKKYGIYLILNMHAPQGGYQSQGKGDALWTNTENQNRLTALWAAIAKKYKTENTIAGFGLVNEPVPVSSLLQWQQLAQRITTAIREEDTNHIIFVEKPIYVKGVAGEDTNLNFPVVNDDNLAYEFHIYDPYLFTHQLFNWANNGDGGKYPDESIISYSNSSWYTATFNNPQLTTGSSDWAYYEGGKYIVSDPKIKLAVPALVARGVTGTAYFDDIIIKEFDAEGGFTGNILNMNLASKDGWGYWSENNTGTANLSTETGNGDAACLYISGATSDCNFSNYNKIFIPKQGYAYQVCGYMKGDNIAVGAACMLRIDFITTTDPIYGRNKAYLSALLKKYADFGKQKNVPIYMGEFGAGTPCFDNNKGGLQWVEDMLDISKENNLYFTYHAYHEDSFGLYYGHGSLPNALNANLPLIDLFKQKLQ